MPEPALAVGDRTNLPRWARRPAEFSATLILHAHNRGCMGMRTCMPNGRAQIAKPEAYGCGKSRSLGVSICARSWTMRPRTGR
jgi:hypothetical protein